MQSLLIALTLLLPPSASFTYTDADRARAERAAQLARFVGPKLPPKPAPLQTSLSSVPPEPKPKKPPRPPSPPRERFYIDGNYIRNSSGGVVAQFGACRSCQQVQAGIRLRRYPRQ